MKVEIQEFKEKFKLKFPFLYDAIAGDEDLILEVYHSDFYNEVMA